MKIHESITPELQAWIQQQKLFFVGSAPLSSQGHVNLSPKGYDCLRILDDMTVCYMDMTGSGNETSAHVQENGRLTFMFCALTGGPRILRLYGRGQVVLRDTAEWDALIDQTGMTILPGARQIVVNHVDKIITSCGYGVPKFDYVQDRSTLQDFATSRHDSDPGLKDYQTKNNMKSLDGLVTPLGIMRSKGGNNGTMMSMVGNAKRYYYVESILAIVVAVAMAAIAASTQADE